MTAPKEPCYEEWARTYVFRAQATGTQPVRYQWYRNGAGVGGTEECSASEERVKDFRTMWECTG